MHVYEAIRSDLHGSRTKYQGQIKAKICLKISSSTCHFLQMMIGLRCGRDTVPTLVWA